MTLPEIRDDDAPPPHQRTVVTAAVVGAAVCLLAVIAGLVLLGMSSENNGEVTSTGLAAIGATLAGGFAGWIARGRGSER